MRRPAPRAAGLAAAAAFAALAGLAACSPCFGVGSCDAGTASMNVDGQVVGATTGKGIDGVQIEMRVIGGRGSLVDDSVTTTTSDGGFWRISVPSPVAESVLVRFRISSPILALPYSEYRWIVPSARKGDAFVTDRWVTTPYYPYYVRLYRRGRPSEIFTNTAMDFHQVHGPTVQGGDNHGTVPLTTDASGYSQLFFYNVFASDTGYIGGRITAHLPPPYGDSKTAVLELYPTVMYLRPGIFLDVAVGPSLAYTVLAQNRADGSPAAGVRVDFARTGGIGIDPATFTLTTDAAGRAVFPAVPLATGTVSGTVTLTPAGGAAETFSVNVPTFDSDSTPVLATWQVGPAASAVLRDGKRGRP